MTWRRVGFWYLVAGLLAAVYWRPVPPSPRTQAAPAGGRPRLLRGGGDGIRMIRVVHAGRLLVLVPVDGGWTVREPGDAPISAGLAAAFASALQTAEVVERAGDAPGDLAPFGLDEQAARVEVLADGVPAQVLLLGASNPTGTAVYARRGADPEVLLIGRNLAYYEELLFQALPPAQVPADTAGPVGGGGG